MRYLYLPLIALLTASQSVAGLLLPGPAFGVNARLVAKPERRDELTALLHQNRASTLQNEPEALQFSFGPDPNDPLVVHLHERFASRHGFDVHRDAPHLDDWREFKASDPFFVPPRFVFYDLAEGSGEVPESKGPGVFCRNVDARIRPEARGDFLEVIRGTALGSRDEELCLQYAWGEDVEVQNLFHFHEEYIIGNGGRDELETLASTPSFEEWKRFAGDGDLFMEPPDMKCFTTL